jgi:hypothetical protein
MKNCLMMIIVLCCVNLALYAQDQRVSEKPSRKIYFSTSYGAYFFGKVKVGGIRAGSEGTPVRDIDTSSGGTPAGFTFDAALGYQITPKWVIEGTLAVGFSSGYVETGYEESKTFYETNGYSAKSFTDHDRVSWSGSFICFDIGASYNLWTSKRAGGPLYINGKLGLGLLSFDTGGLRYSTMDGWHAGQNPGADYDETFLLDTAEGFFIKPGFDFGMKIADWRVMLNTHVKIFPLAIGNVREAVINSGGWQRSVKLTQPAWIVPSLTLGMQYYFR